MTTSSRSSRRPAPLNSLLEAELYFMVAACPACGGGLAVAAEHVHWDAPGGVLTVPAHCTGCGGEVTRRFATRRVPAGELQRGCVVWPPSGERSAEQPINPGGRRSAVIDVAGWLSLHDRFVEAARLAGQESDAAGRGEVRRLLLLAGACLEEALRFYEPENDLPPARGLFTAASRRQLREHPERFARPRLIGLRARLPFAALRRNRPA